MPTQILTAQSTDWNQIEATFFVGGVPYGVPTIKQIEWSWKVTPEKAYGAGPDAYDGTGGQVQNDNAKFKIGLSDWVPLLNAIAQSVLVSPQYIANPFPATDPLRLAASKGGAFTVTFHYTVNNQPMSITLSGARVVGATQSIETGSTEAVMDVELFVLRVAQS